MYDILLNIFRCLFQPLKDKNVCAPLPNLLNDMINCLETMPGTGSMEVRIMLSFFNMHGSRNFRQGGGVGGSRPDGQKAA